MCLGQMEESYSRCGDGASRRFKPAKNPFSPQTLSRWVTPNDVDGASPITDIASPREKFVDDRSLMQFGCMSVGSIL